MKTKRLRETPEDAGVEDDEDRDEVAAERLLLGSIFN